MESIYYVMSWVCHRTCRHCYEDRFRPYHGSELDTLMKKAEQAFPRVIGHLPERLLYRDPSAPVPDDSPNPESHLRQSRIILAGGEILLEPVRRRILYPALEMLRERYSAQGGVKVVVQTTGDIVKPQIVEDLLDRGVWMISVSGIDEFHDGLQSDLAQQELINRLTETFESFGMRGFEEIAGETGDASDSGRHFQFFGARPGTWIGQLWPRGRAMKNGLSTATLRDNFCNQWSGGLGFLDIGRKGSEVSIDPDGNVFPCCLKTKMALGSLLDEPLEEILRRSGRSPVYQAISAGRPELMGLAHGWSPERFLRASSTRLDNGHQYENLCVGCDRFHEEVLMAQSSNWFKLMADSRYQRHRVGEQQIMSIRQ